MFNGKTGILLGEKPEGDPKVFDFSKVKFKTVEIDEIMEYYDGDYDTGEIKSVDEKPVLNESIVNSQTELAITDQYPIHKQLNILIDMVNKSDMPNTPEFTAMMQHITDQVEAGKEKKEVFKESDAYVYVSEEQAKVDAEKAVDFD